MTSSFVFITPFQKRSSYAVLFTCAFLFTVVYVLPHTLNDFFASYLRLPAANSLSDAPQSLSLNSIHHQLSILTAESQVIQPTPVEHDVCLFLSPNPSSSQFWQSNSRTLCVTSPLCLMTNKLSIIHTSDFSKTTCRMTAPDFHALPQQLEDLHRFDPSFIPCSSAQPRAQLCPLVNGSLRLGKLPQCLPTDPTPQNIFNATLRQSRNDGLLFEGISVIVPIYPYPANIYHFAASIATVSHVVSNLDNIIAHFGPERINPHNAREVLPLNIIFMNRRRINLPWQLSLERALSRGRIATTFPKGVKITYLPELHESGSKYACILNPISMGQRGHVNAWPFVNSTEILLDGSRIPRDAVEFRRDIYKYFDIKVPPIITSREEYGNCSHDNEGNCADDDDGEPFRQVVGRMPVPPLVLGYSRRLGLNASVGKGVHEVGTVRRFSEIDEQWFMDLLARETKLMGIKLITFTPSPDETFEAQVRRMVDIGFVVGIHGANLVNNLFMRPFGAMFEIFPANSDSMCYKAGANSGLAYFSHHASEEATPEESGCSPSQTRCRKLKRQRMVKIHTKRDRREIQRKIRMGIDHIITLNKRYKNKGGIPVLYNWVTGSYDIADWKRTT